MTGPTVTLWHRLVRVAEWMAEMMTGWSPEAPEICPPNCSNPVPVSLLAVMRYSWPETEMLEAMAPCAVSPMSVPATMTAGTATIANRRHLTRPCVCVRLQHTGKLLLSKLAGQALWHNNGTEKHHLSRESMNFQRSRELATSSQRSSRSAFSASTAASRAPSSVSFS